MLEAVNKEVTTKPNRKYEPLTDEQKAEMKEDQIKKWEDKAKEGLLFNDTDLRSLTDSMRFIFESGSLIRMLWHLLELLRVLIMVTMESLYLMKQSLKLLWNKIRPTYRNCLPKKRILLMETRVVLWRGLLKLQISMPERLVQQKVF